MLSAKEFLKYGKYYCDYYFNKSTSSGCSEECEFKQISEKMYKESGNYNRSFCVFPECSNAYYDLDFALDVIERFKIQCEQPITFKEYIDNKGINKIFNDYLIIHNKPCKIFKEAKCLNEKDCNKEWCNNKECWEKVKCAIMPEAVDKVFEN